MKMARSASARTRHRQKQKGRNDPAFRHPPSHQCQYIRGQRQGRNCSQIDHERSTKS